SAYRRATRARSGKRRSHREVHLRSNRCHSRSKALALGTDSALHTPAWATAKSPETQRQIYPLFDPEYLPSAITPLMNAVNLYSRILYAKLFSKRHRLLTSVHNSI